MNKAFYVRDLMTVGVPTVAPETDARDIARFLLDHNLEEVVVLEEGNNVGVVGYEELVKAYDKYYATWDPVSLTEDAEEKPVNLTAEDVMRPEIVSVPPDLPLTTAAQIMRDKGLRAVYLTHHAGGMEYPAAWLTYRHLVRHLAAQSEEDLKDLGIYAHRKSPIEIFIQRREDAKRRQNPSN